MGFSCKHEWVQTRLGARSLCGIWAQGSIAKIKLKEPEMGHECRTCRKILKGGKSGAKLVLEGEWRCYCQEGGFAAPEVAVDCHELGFTIDHWLGLELGRGESGIQIRITVERLAEDEKKQQSSGARKMTMGDK